MDRDNVIEVKKISKQYRLGLIGTGTLSHDLNRMWAKLRGKEDPYALVGEVNDRTSIGESKYVNALEDINFNVKRGEVLGIIGRNGAGKSTLLKILSRVTGPSSGEINIQGRVASLLEVGTGFHPELTGRENVFLNGAILGMKKKEIDSKFDDIVEFSGVQKYIDTPVKRYSSGMKVRLGFAVAAYLEPDILIVDEVLAVGDFDFQEKCIGKMNEISREGKRTILFVSHNLESVKKLCSRGILVENGSIRFDGSVDETISLYTQTKKSEGNRSENFALEKKDIDKLVTGRENLVGVNAFEFQHVELTQTSRNEGERFHSDKEIHLKISYSVFETVSNLRIAVQLCNSDGNELFTTLLNDHVASKEQLENISLKGKYNIELSIPPNILASNEYNMNIHLIDAKKEHHQLSNVLNFAVQYKGSMDGKYGNFEKANLRPLLSWKVGSE